jgi:hypothetical protein
MASFALFGLGYGMFLTTARISFSSTGLANRVAIAGALGVAMSLTAFAGWFSTLPSKASVRRRSFAFLIAVLCVSGCLINNSLARYWVAAWPQQLAVRDEIRSALPTLPAHTTVILHGVCPYMGPAVIYESDWDLAGILQVTYGDRTLKADVTSNRLVVEPYGVVTRIYGRSNVHPFEGRLVLYDHGRGNAVALVDEQAAVRFFGTRRPGLPDGCAKGTPGKGVNVLPTDDLYDWLEARGFLIG